MIRYLLTPLLAITALAQPAVDERGALQFVLRAPTAQRVLLLGQWQKEPLELVKGDKGQWSLRVEKVPAGVWEYSFSVDGLNVIDPLNPALKPQRSPSKNILHIPSTPLAAWDWQDVPHGTVHLHQYDSQAVGARRELVVYTPPGYESGEGTFPLLILQHGSGDNQRAWVEHGKAHWILDNLIASGKAVPMVIVMLDGHPLGMVPREDVAKRMEAFSVFEKELFSEALPLVEKLYRVEKEGARRGFAGLSMGGSQALHIGLTNSDKLGWIGAFSTAPGSTEAGRELASAADTLNANLKLLWIACGRDDFLVQRHQQFLQMLADGGVKHTGLITDGDHSWPVWRRYLADFLPLVFR